MWHHVEEAEYKENLIDLHNTQVGKELNIFMSSHCITNEARKFQRGLMTFFPPKFEITQLISDSPGIRTYIFWFLIIDDLENNVT